MIKDADEIALLRLAAQAADRVVAQIAAGRLVGRTEADVAHEVRERLIAEGHDTALFAIVGSGPELRLAPPRGVRARHPGGRADRARHRRHARRATARTSRGRCGSPAATRRTGPDEAFRHLFGVLLGAPGRGDARRSDRASPARRSTPPRAGRSTPRATARRSSIGPGTASASRATRTRTWSPATTCRCGDGMAFSVEPGIYLVGRVRGAHRGHRRVRPGRPDRAQRGAPRAATSSTADTGTVAWAGVSMRACGIIGRRIGPIDPPRSEYR